MSDPLVLRADGDGVRTLTLNRPDRRNALNVALLEAIRAQIAAAAASSTVRAVVLTGAGKGFCAGADVSEWSDAAAAGDDSGVRWERNAHALMQELFELPKPTVAILNGAAVGAGLDLACCCDFRIAADDAFFACAYTWMGYCPDAGGSWLYPRLMGLDAAKRFVFTGERWDAAMARERGLVSEVVLRADLEAAGQALATTLASGPTVALGLGKALLHGAAARSFGDQLEAERAAGAICAGTADASEALAAAVAKRSAVFSGR